MVETDEKKIPWATCGEDGSQGGLNSAEEERHRWLTQKESKANGEQPGRAAANSVGKQTNQTAFDQQKE
eukprot:3888844-Prorocentrum_lima.AAC.1